MFDETLDKMPTLALSGSKAALARGGAARPISRDEAQRLLTGAQPLLLCHALLTARPLYVEGQGERPPAPIFDVMELFAFVHPACSVPPTASGLARFLNLPIPKDAPRAALSIHQAAKILLNQLVQNRDEDAWPIADMMRKAGWRWGALVCRALQQSAPSNKSSSWLAKLLRLLPEWQPPRASARKNDKMNNRAMAKGVDSQQALSLLKAGLGSQAEPRAGQLDYMRDVSELFQPRRSLIAPPVMLAEADTGIGKTLGYLVPAFLFAQTSPVSVWVATYTRALQNQIDRETARLIPDEAQRAKKIAIRKGRENYLCLLNFEEALRIGGYEPVLAGLVARWLKRTRDGDIRSGDFPSWLIAGRTQAQWLSSLTDRRETCIHSACPHYRRCFVEHQRAASFGADLTIANHALVLSQSLFADELPQGKSSQENPPPHYIFDEGHHIFSAADSAFSFRLTGISMSALRHWLMGEDAQPRGWASRGLALRMEDVLRAHKHLQILLDELCAAARFLPREGWRQRIARGHPAGAAEEFLNEIRGLVLEQSQSSFDYSFEEEMAALHQAGSLKSALENLQQKMGAFAAALAVLDEDDLSSCLSIQRVLSRWIEHELPVWTAMSARATKTGGLVQWIDRLVVERDEGREVDVGMCRNALDPTRAFAQNILLKSSGVLITSASLRGLQTPSAWTGAEQRVGAHCLPYPARHIYKASPFDYAQQARVFVANDIANNEKDIAHAMALLFAASGGGGLGIFTAVRRLKAAYRMIAHDMQRSGRLLLAQHVDPMATSALVDIFREDEDSCLLGTDALRDGVDVPGRSLRLMAFDRMPWARPDILHRARRKFFGRRDYDDMIAGLRLQQAFGRLIRRQTDRGVFVLLDRKLPSRLEGVFPEKVKIARLPLAQVVRQVRGFLRDER